MTREALEDLTPSRSDSGSKEFSTGIVTRVYEVNEMTRRRPAIPLANACNPSQRLWRTSKR